MNDQSFSMIIDGRRVVTGKTFPVINPATEAVIAEAPEIDDDLVQAAYDVGCRKFWMVYDSLVYHLVGKSNNQQTVDKDSDKPYEYFVDKWKKRGYTMAAHPGQWHPKLIPWYVKII